MKHTKKIAVLLAAILSMTSFAACGSTDSSKEEAASSASTSEESEAELDETTTMDDITFSVSSDWRKEKSENGGYTWYAKDLSFFQVNTSDAGDGDETKFLAALYISFKRMDGVTEYSDPEAVEIGGANGVKFSINMDVEDYGERTMKLYCMVYNKKNYNFLFTSMDEDSCDISDYEDDIISSISFAEKSTELEASVITETTTKATTTTEKVTEKATEPIKETVEYYSGTHKVGEDIPAGEYCIFATKSKRSGYYSVNSDSNGDNIIGNGIFDYNAFVTVSDGQYLELSNAKAVPIEDVDKIETNETGMFRVGIDIPAGEYQVIPTKEGSSGYYCIYNSSEPNAPIVANDLFEGQAYATVSEGQYLVLERAKFAQ